MPILSEIKASQFEKDPNKQIEVISKQLNEWGRLISNEATTRVIKSDSTTDAMKIGDLGDNKFGIGIGNGADDFLTLTKDGIEVSDGSTVLITINQNGITSNDGTNDRFFIGNE